MKFDINDCHDIAINRSGKCHAPYYKNNRQKITWECYNNHFFDLSLKDVREGKWCNTCRENNFKDMAMNIFIYQISQEINN